MYDLLSRQCFMFLAYYDRKRVIRELLLMKLIIQTSLLGSYMPSCLESVWSTGRVNIGLQYIICLWVTYIVENRTWLKFKAFTYSIITEKN